MADQFTIKKERSGTLYSCEKYSCFVRGTVLSDVTINENIEEYIGMLARRWLFHLPKRIV